MASMGKGKKGKRPDKVPQLPSVTIEDEADGERLFLESLEKMDSAQILREKGADDIEAQARADANKASPRSSNRAGGDGADFSVDLHRLNLQEAQARIDRVLSQILSKLASGNVTLKVITGKGRHSVGASVMPREAHSYVKTHYGRYIVRIDDSPADLVVGELPLRGHFNVTFGRR